VNDHHRLTRLRPGAGQRFWASDANSAPIVDAHFDVKSVMVRIDDEPFDWYQTPRRNGG